MKLFKAIKTNETEPFATRQCETEEEFLEWINSKPVKWRGKQNWYLPASSDDEGNIVLPEGRIDDTVFVVNVPESTYLDDEGVEQTSAAYSYDTYKMVDEWSYSVEDVSDQLAREARVSARKVKAAKHKATKDFCDELIALIGANNDVKNLTIEQRISLKALPELTSMLSDATAGFLSSIKATLTAYTPDGVLFTDAEKAEYLQEIADFEAENL